ncbi:MAG: RNA polymerase sigma factor [Clostridia bacterium]|nr:RNA polymerase sigma factor [Clostridia bacterium]
MNLDTLAPKIAKRDKQAFQLLYEQLHRLVFTVCLGVVKNRGVAEELMQDTFVSVWTKSVQFRGRGYKTWILTIARNKALNALRQTGREYAVDFNENESALGSYDMDADTGVVLKLALSKLNEQDRQIVLMRNGGLQAKEIAKTLGLPRGTVSWRYAEALKILRTELGGAL